MTTAAAASRARIAVLNDRCRLGRDPRARILFTRNCLAAFAAEDDDAGIVRAQLMLLAAVRRHVFTATESDERDRGAMHIGGREVRFRIDYYDLTLEWGSPDPADPEVTTRVLTIMLPEDD